MTVITVIIFISIIIMDYAVAFLTACVVIIVAMITKSCVFIAVYVLAPYSFTATVTDRCEVIDAVRA